jgi:CHAD domain-containing protein
MSALRSQGRRTPVSPCAMLIEALEDRHRNFAVQLARVRRRPSEPGVHDLRVATRRLVAVIDLISGVAQDPLLQKRRKALRSFLKGFNALRDAHIQRMALRKLRAAFPSAGMCLRGMQVQERELLRATGRSVRTFDSAGLRAAIAEAEDALLRISINPALASATQAILAGELAAAFARVVRRRQMLNGTDPTTVHRMRVAFKRFRYSLEILSPLLPWMTADTRSRLNDYQTAMGKIQDTVVLLQGIADFEAKRPVTGRMALIEVREYLLRRRMELMNAFLAHADVLSTFWRGERT